jgi:hypothetical protein
LKIPPDFQDVTQAIFLKRRQKSEKKLREKLEKIDFPVFYLNCKALLLKKSTSCSIFDKGANVRKRDLDPTIPKTCLYTSEWPVYVDRRLELELLSLSVAPLQAEKEFGQFSPDPCHHRECRLRRIVIGT